MLYSVFVCVGGGGLMGVDDLPAVVIVCCDGHNIIIITVTLNDCTVHVNLLTLIF